MDIYIDRTIEFGQLLPPGAPDLTLALGQHPFHLALPERPGESVAVRLRAATYCGVTDVLQFIAEALPPDGSMADDAEFEPRDNARLRRVQLSELLLAPLNALPRLSFDTDRLNASANDGQVTRAQTLARGLSWQHRADGRVEVRPDPQTPPRVLTGWRTDPQSTQLTMSNHLGRPTDQTVDLEELTADARRAALDLMQTCQEALTEIDSLQALQPTLRAISRARHGHIDRASPDTVRQAVERHRERASLEVGRLLQELRNGA
ncbi:hypothetical protein [Aquabacterium parvum]|uniref:hypothetical protein n=1 Tax=Aquabacterium parvum TaxID=70584 RepID=UPI000718F742|nr:hypothetical protein [Aquabacterium parvum]MBU0915013.1 hypothetical protein [Gammaproteobacteria bacterium]